MLLQLEMILCLMQNLLENEFEKNDMFICLITKLDTTKG